MSKPPFNSRELSWLDFNERVLEQALRTDFPVLERLKFLSVTASNLDEFFMVRVAYLHDKCKNSRKEKEKTDDAGYSAREQLELVLERARDFQRRQIRCLEGLREELAREGVRLLTLRQLDGEQQAEVEQMYLSDILPVLTPFAVDPARPFPFLVNRALYIGVRMRDQQGRDRYGLVQLPSNLSRFLPVPAGKDKAFLLLEEAVAAHLGGLFGLYEIKAWGIFRITRSADFDADEDTDDLLEEMKRTIKKRKRGKVIRLELEERAGAFDRDLQRYLVGMLRVRKRYRMPLEGPLDLAAMGNIPGVKGLEQLRLPAIEPVEAADFSGCGDLFGAIRQRDRLVHMPFESFGHVTGFIEAAAADPEVLAIKQTLYRVSGDSRVISALEKAAEQGKQVTVVVELRARFDEEKNIRWADRLEKAGCNVIYGLTGLKTHCKITLVVRREEQGVRRYVYLSTGNFNDATARAYTDLGLFTCQAAFGADASDLFNHLTGFSKPPQYRKLVAAPQEMKSFFLMRIDREMENVREGKPGGIVAKVNSLLDGSIVKKLYEASEAGVPVRLLIRGICSLVPGVERYSENIRVRSIVGQLLEHSRIFCFENGGDPLVYLGSADLMPRNLERRVELLFPVEEPLLRRRLITTLELYWRDNVDAREQDHQGRYRPVTRRGKRVCAQQELARLAERGWRQGRRKKSGKEERGSRQPPSPRPGPSETLGRRRPPPAPADRQ